MSDAERFLQLLRARGLRVRAEGLTLRVGPPALVTEEISAGVRRHKSALLMLLEGELKRKEAEALPAPEPWSPPEPLDSAVSTTPEPTDGAPAPAVAQGVPAPAAPVQSAENAVQRPPTVRPAQRRPAPAAHQDDAAEMRPCGGGCGRMTYRGWACSRCNQKLADIELRRGRTKEG